MANTIRSPVCALALAAALAASTGAANGQASGKDASDASHQMYLELQRQPDAFVGKPLSFAGKVIQSARIGNAYVLRINVTPGRYNSWQDTIYVDYKAAGPAVPDKIAEGDLVSVRGTYTGMKSYQSVIGDTIKVPSVTACLVRPGVSNLAECPRSQHRVLFGTAHEQKPPAVSRRGP